MATTARSLIKGETAFVRDDDTVLDAAKRLAGDGIGALPICRLDGRVEGMITDRDIVVNVIARGKDPAKVRVGELASGTPIVVEADAPIEEAARVMSEHKVRRLMVVDGNECIGVISQADLAKALSHEQTGELLEEISSD